MNIVNFWAQQVNKWHTEEKCGLCWEFFAPLTESAVSIAQSDNCCVKVFLLRDKAPAFNVVNTYNGVTNMLTNSLCNINFQLLVVMTGNIGLNNFNEIPNHPTSQSKWSTMLYEIENCLACDARLDFCEILGRQYNITQWSATQVINNGDNAYTGYRLNVSFQKLNENT